MQWIGIIEERESLIQQAVVQKKLQVKLGVRELLEHLYVAWWGIEGWVDLSEGDVKRDFHHISRCNDVVVQ